MGNQICSINIQNISKQQFHQKQIQKLQKELNSSICIPKPKSQVLAVLQNKKQFQLLYQQKIQRYKKKMFGEETYVGQLSNTGIPHGFGKMYKVDGSLYLGRFAQGKAEGTGLYIFSDGSYFQGKFKNNKAQCLKGQFHTKQFHYIGAFKDNVFDGQGKQQSNTHQFIGTYCNGKKQFGQLQWWCQPKQNNYYHYSGYFDNQGKFTGSGVLQEPTGLYKGKFVNGKKQGKGVYAYNKNLKYSGEYKDGKRHGYGKIIQFYSNKIIFEGEWKDGLPDGEGTKYDVHGHQIKAFYKQGINTKS